MKYLNLDINETLARVGSEYIMTDSKGNKMRVWYIVGLQKWIYS